MILLDVKRYIRTQGRASLSDLCHRFDLSEDTAQWLIAPLIRQGHIQPISGQCQTGGCKQCASQLQYQWLERRQYGRPFPIAIQTIGQGAT
ncbi:MAG: transcriptional regulator [Thiotrichales bacterium]|nr:transcriptional regulator [Thiotrichales bacterium]